eukprot:1160222-Pelagomonas_calceolata.AAC.3
MDGVNVWFRNGWCGGQTVGMNVLLWTCMGPPGDHRVCFRGGRACGCGAGKNLKCDSGKLHKACLHVPSFSPSCATEAGRHSALPLGLKGKGKSAQGVDTSCVVVRKGQRPPTVKSA